MATTGFKPVHGKIGRSLAYDKKTEKITDFKSNGTGSSVPADDAQGSKPAGQRLISGINCSTQFAQEEMEAVEKRFGRRGNVTAYQAWQSFVKGEVKPDLAHKIGVETARRMWGDQYQVIVTTHLNTDHIHNHFLVNAYSFCDGSKFPNKRADHLKLAEISDDICQWKGLSVPEGKILVKRQSQGAYHKDKREEPELIRNVKKDTEYCIQHSASWDELCSLLGEKGYEIWGWDSMEIKSKDGDFTVPVEKLGISNESIISLFEQNSVLAGLEYNAHPPQMNKQCVLLQILRNEEDQKIQMHAPGETALERLYPETNPYRKLYQMTHLESEPGSRGEITPGAVFSIYENLEEMTRESRDEITSPRLRHLLTDEKRKDDHQFLKENGFYHAADLKRDIGYLQSQMKELRRQKKRLYDRIRRSKDPKRIAEYEEQRKELDRELASIQDRVKREKKILNSLPRLYGLLEKEVFHEQEYLSRMRNRSRQRGRDRER